MSKVVNLELAKKTLATGEIISYPTETFFGLGVDPKNENAVNKLLDIKGRSSSISLIASSVIQVNNLPIIEDNRNLRIYLQEHFWPGPLTLIIKVDSKKIPFSLKLLAADQTIAVRVSSSHLATKLAETAGGFITATSSNPKGEPPAKNEEESLNYFPELTTIPRIEVGDSQPSTIIHLEQKKILRKGAIPSEKLANLLCSEVG